MILGPKIANSNIIDIRKKKVSIITVYNTIDTALAADIFSCDRKNTATAEPPTLIGDIADANSHIVTNSTVCLRVKTLSDNILSLIE
jgi:hypothetical protein